MTRFSNPVPKYTDQSGDFMPYGLLYFFESGTNGDKTTFADVNETIPNTQPLVLNGDGSVPNCFFSGSAKVTLVTNAGTKDNPIDGVQQWERDPVTSSSIGSIGRVWDAVSIYDKNSVVVHDDLFYVSIINNNQNNNPSSTPTAWSQFDLLVRFNINETYQLADPVIASDGFLYTSAIANNTGNDPTLGGGQWTLPAISLSNGDNLAINSALDFWQRGTPIVGSEYTADRWKANNANVTTTRVTGPTTLPFTYHASMVRSTMGNILLSQGIELVAAGDANVFIVGSSWTISYDIWAESAVDSHISADFVDDVDGTGSVEVLAIVSETLPVQTWKRISTTFTVAASPGVGNLALRIRVGASDVPLGEEIRVSGIKLEIGTLETLFTRAANTLEGELAMCQRYYEKSYSQLGFAGSATNTGALQVVSSQAGSTTNARQSAGLYCNFREVKRVTPALAFFSPLDGTAGMCDDTVGNIPCEANGLSDSGFNARLSAGNSAVDGDRYRYQWTADAEL